MSNTAGQVRAFIERIVDERLDERLDTYNLDFEEVEQEAPPPTLTPAPQEPSGYLPTPDGFGAPALREAISWERRTVRPTRVDELRLAIETTSGGVVDLDRMPSTIALGRAAPLTPGGSVAILGRGRTLTGSGIIAHDPIGTLVVHDLAIRNVERHGAQTGDGISCAQVARVWLSHLDIRNVGDEGIHLSQWPAGLDPVVASVSFCRIEAATGRNLYVSIGPDSPRGWDTKPTGEQLDGLVRVTAWRNHMLGGFRQPAVRGCTADLVNNVSDGGTAGLIYGDWPFQGKAANGASVAGSRIRDDRNARLGVANPRRAVVNEKGKARLSAIAPDLFPPTLEHYQAEAVSNVAEWRRTAGLVTQ